MKDRFSLWSRGKRPEIPYVNVRSLRDTSVSRRGFALFVVSSAYATHSCRSFTVIEERRNLPDPDLLPRNRHKICLHSRTCIAAVYLRTVSTMCYCRRGVSSYYSTRRAPRPVHAHELGGIVAFLYRRYRRIIVAPIYIMSVAVIMDDNHNIIGDNSRKPRREDHRPVHYSARYPT